MKENKEKFIILGIVICLLLLITFVLFILSKNEENNINREIKKLENDNYYLVQNLVNNYYYDEMNNNEYTNPSFIANEIFYNDDKKINYYFINGYFIDREFDGEYKYDDNVNYLVIIKNDFYNITKLENVSNIEYYANNYEIINVNVNEKKLPTYYLSLENKLTYYIALFKDLVEIDPEKAYSMLGSDTLKKYANYNEFYNSRLDILNGINTYVDGYEKKDNNKYIVVDKKSKKTIITENSPMHFKIDF